MPRQPHIPSRKLLTPIKKAASQQAQVDALLQEGFSLHQQGKLKEAQAIYKQVLQIQPNNFDALQLLGALMVLTKNYSQAIEYLTKALHIRPDYAEGHYNQGAAPYNAGTTASDTLWAGLPVLTLMGHSFASRVAASLLHAIDLPELITTTPAEYEALAIELATKPDQLNAIKQKLSLNRLTSPLFNTPLFTRHIECAYTQIMERYWEDMPPEHIDIESELGAIS